MAWDGHLEPLEGDACTCDLCAARERIGWQSAMIKQLREALMAAEEAKVSTDAGSVSERVSNVIGDVLGGRTTLAQNKALADVATRAQRVSVSSDKAVGKAIGG